MASYRLRGNVSGCLLNDDINEWILYDLFQAINKKNCKKINKAIDVICGTSTWHGSLSRLAAPRVIFFEKTKNLFYIRSMGVCVANFRSVSFFVWSGGVTNTQIHTYTSENIYPTELQH